MTDLTEPREIERVPDAERTEAVVRVAKYVVMCGDCGQYIPPERCFYTPYDYYSERTHRMETWHPPLTVHTDGAWEVDELPERVTCPDCGLEQPVSGACLD